MQTATQYGTVLEVAELLKLSPSYLTKLRLYQPQESPPFIRIGRRVRYPLDGSNGVLEWAARRGGGAQ